MNDIMNMRKLMETVNHVEKQPVDEAGGIIDKGLAKLGSQKADKRVDFKKEQTHIEKGWKEWQAEREAASPDFKKNDPESFKEFLAYWEFSGEEIDKIAAEPLDIKKAIPVAAEIQFLSKKGVTGDKRGGPVKKKPPGDDYDSIMSHYLKTLGGDIAILKAEMIQAGKKPKTLDDMAMVGWAWMQANGKDTGNPKAGKNNE